MIFLYRYISLIIIFFLLFPLGCHSAPSVSAEAAIVIENSSGRAVCNKNADKRMPMASTTKIMTAICAIENTYPDKLITVNDAAVGIEGSSVYLAKGEKITIKDLLYAMMLNSGNDAATALACEVSGSVEKFSVLMNKTAQRIGAKNTHFTNPSGLYEENHYTTASDLALITSYALKNPLFSEIVSSKEKTITNGDKDYPRNLRNHNKLLWQYDGCTGVKTGYTKKCGRCLVSSATRDGVELTCVTLNAPDDWNDHKRLLDYGFSKCKEICVAKESDYCMSVTLGKNNSQRVKLKFKDSLFFVRFSDKPNNVSITYHINENVSFPLSEGESIGKACIYADGILCSESELLCGESVICVEEKSFFRIFRAGLKAFFDLAVNSL